MTPLHPGLLVLHGNRLESLRDAVFDWLQRNPLEPLEEEFFLVQSNGAAEWLKMALARAAGVCAATRVELPGRFLWRAYRLMLGRDRVPPKSALERSALAWRMMRLLPERLAHPAFAPVAAFLDGGDTDRRLQLARHLADLYDQYQVYRADWLAAWEHGRALLPAQGGRDQPLPRDQLWQMELWRALLGELSRDERASTRPRVHQAFMTALEQGMAPAAALPRRVVLFGASHIPMQTLEALAALSTRLQVIVAVPNPCRYHWADIIEGREALRAARHRHPSATSADLSALPLDAMHLHGHPLLAAWGRQGRDFMRQLDAFDDVDETRRRFELPRVDLFDDDPGRTLLEEVQAAIRDLVPLAEHARDEVGRDDRSIVFHVAHGPQREVEILHDQLLAMLASTAPGRLKPRDVVVMVPDIEAFAPAIRAVFGQHRRDDARWIPFDIADLRSRGSNPLVVAFEWLLRIRDKRIRVQEIRDVVDVPAVAARFGLAPESIPGLFAWLDGAGVRWGLHARHRDQLGLGAAGDQNSWLFGLRRMLLGYATGDAAAFDGIEPYDEVGGLEASAVGSLAAFFERIEDWWSVCATDATPTEWAARGRALIAAFLAPTDEPERLTIAALQAALAAWLEACEVARFVEKVPLSVVREAWFADVEGLDANRRFLAGGVTFCTLMPLRAVPFEVVCLLGMNEGDFPRRGRRDDYDLMALPGQQRPGDRSRRDDDRYLMLEAVLSARRTLYVSWCGRSARDNGEQPPSVLVAQLRDYLGAGWRGADGGDVVDQRTTVHPLQPFSRRYFEGEGLVTYAREWRVAHAVSTTEGGGEAIVDGVDDAAINDSQPKPFEASDVALTVQQLARFLKNPVRAFFRARLDVHVGDDEARTDEDEPFGVAGLAAYRLRAELLDAPSASDAAADLARRVDRAVRSGRLPMSGVGARVADELFSTVRPMLERWHALQAAFPHDLPRVALRVAWPTAAPDLRIDDWLGGLRGDGERSVWIATTASRLVDPKDDSVRAGKLLMPWVRMLVASACGERPHGFLIGPDASLEFAPLAADAAAAALTALLDAWRDGMAAPLPFAAATALAFVQDPGKGAATYDGGYNIERAEGGEFCLQRLYPTFGALVHDGRFVRYAHALFGPLRQWVASSVTIVAIQAPAAAAIDAAAEAAA